jgi:ABC-type dipeptide/oligopeptide/nickel transport system permease subunit
MEEYFHHSPGYYVRRRLQQNKASMFGVGVILISAIVALLGYLLMPDSTPGVNDGAIQIQKQLPGFSTKLLKIRKNMEHEEQGWLSKMFFGERSPFVLIPIQDYRVEGYTVEAEMFGREGEWQQYDLLNTVKALYVGDSEQPGFENGENFLIDGERVRYVNIDGQVMETNRQALLDEFHERNLEERTYWLGTDKAGRDMLSRLMFGARISLSIGFVSVIISMALGTLLGALAGFFGGKVDSLIMWLMSVVWSIPGIMLVIAISLALQSRGVWVAFIAVGLTMWVEVARVVRGQILGIKQKLYIEAARAFGVSNPQIIYAHILPNIFGPLIVIATANFAAAILLEAGLSFLGLSVQPPTPSWGIMIYEGYHAIGTRNSWHLVALPAIAICLMVLSFNLLGNGLRDAYDPKTLLK